MAGLVLLLVSAGAGDITGAFVETDGGARMAEGLGKLWQINVPHPDVQ